MHRAFRITCLAAAAASLAGLTGMAAVLAQEVRTETCTLQAGPTRSVVRVIDSETVLLDDQQEVRLIGALAPRSPDFSPSAEPWPPEEAAIAALMVLVQGRSVSIAASGRPRDRYGRQLAHLFVEDGGERVWVQGEMLSAGHARAYGLPGSYACMRELMAHERVARDAAAGLWSSAAYAVRSARATRNLLRRRNSYEIVAGTVAKVAVTKTRTYVNFGSDWRRDFTAGIEARVLRTNPELEQMLASLEGRRVEVRGWIQYRNGPYIDIEDPSQIAVVNETFPGRTPAPPAAATSSDQAPTPGKEKRPAPSAPGALDL